MRHKTGLLKPILALCFLISIVYFSCQKGNQSPSPQTTTATSTATDVSNSTAPPADAPAILTKVCSNQSCTSFTWQCTWNGVPLKWPGNTNFVYEIGKIGVNVGAPLPSTQGWSTLISGDGQPAPLGTMILTTWQLGTLCINQLAAQTDRFQNAVSDYNTAWNNYAVAMAWYQSDPAHYSLPSQPTIQAPVAANYIHNNTACPNDDGAMPHVSAIYGCKLVVYNYDTQGHPIFAVAPISWHYTGNPAAPIP